MASGWYSVQELAGLPGMPGSDRRVRSMLEKNLPASRAKVRGKGREYPISCLPPETQFILRESELARIAPTVSSGAVTATPLSSAPKTTLAGLLLPQSANSLTDKQRAERDARHGVLSAIRKVPHLSALIERLQVTILLLRLARDKQMISTKAFARTVPLTVKIGKQATGWRNKYIPPVSRGSRLP